MEQQQKTDRISYLPLVIGGIFLLLFLFLISRIFYGEKPFASKPGPLPAETTVILGKDGFSPPTVTINQNTAVRWKNKSGTDGSVNSDNYPTNRLFPEINLGKFSNGMALAHIFTKKGTYRYHNQLHPTLQGTIIVR